MDFSLLKPLCGFYTYGVSDTTYLDFPRAISLVFKLSDGILDQIHQGPTHAYFHHYRTVNAAIDRAAYIIGTQIESEGYRYFPIAASQTVGGEGSYRGLFSHKEAAARAGLGVIGRNGLFLAKDIGAGVRLGTIFTDMPLETKTVTPSGCMGCGACAKLCPAQAIYNQDFDPQNPQKDLLDRRACSEYMKRAYQKIGRGAVCGICMANCPQK